MPPTPRRDFLGYLQALGPLTAALTALGVGFMQWHLQKQHLKQNRFDRRYRVYSGVQGYLAAIRRGDGEFDDQTHQQFRSETDAGELLFPKAVWEYIQAVDTKGLELRSVQRSVNDLHAVDLAEANREANRMKHWISDAYFNTTKKVFLNYVQTKE
jgi:hypothetical protein